MRFLRLLLLLALGSLALPCVLRAQPLAEWKVSATTEGGSVEYEFATKTYVATNGVEVRYGGAVMVADAVKVNEETGQVVADGKVRIQRDDQIWVGEHVLYNFKTHQMEAAQFRTGKAPMYASGLGLHGEITNRFYVATNAIITTDDISEPGVSIRAKSIEIIPGDRIIAHHATLYAGGVPVFYFPYYSHSLDQSGNQFLFVPGYRSTYGSFLLTGYRWVWNDQLDGALHLDYREKRGPGVGPDLNYNFGNKGEGTLKYYYTYDKEPDSNGNNPNDPYNRQRVLYTYLGEPATNLSVRSQVRWQGDPDIVKNFFEQEYRQDPQPSTYVEASKLWPNFSFNGYVQPRVNDFLQTVERLPEARITGYRQQIGETPFYYESETSAGYYETLFAQTNGPPSAPEYAAARADSFQQITLPHTFFNFLNVTPRVGGRYTYYSAASGPGATTDAESRWVFNTGMEVSFKASRLWPEMHSDFFEMDGARHIFQPYVNYVYVPTPNVVGTNNIPQFDQQEPTLRLLPIEYPQYNSIDSLNAQNVLRVGMNNKIQTKREGQVVNVVNWDLYTDWNLQPLSYQNTFSDLFSDLIIRPRSWLTFESLLAWNLSNNQWDLALNTLTFQLTDKLSWGLSHYYVRTNDTFGLAPPGPGNNLFSSSLFYRINENWGFRAYERINLQGVQVQEQGYALYRDLRSWTAALAFRVRENPTGPTDYTVAFTFSLKAFPRYNVGSDALRPLWLLGD